MKFDQDLCLNLQYDFGKMNSTLGSVVPLAMFICIIVETNSKVLNQVRKDIGCGFAEPDIKIPGSLKTFTVKAHALT